MSRKNKKKALKKQQQKEIKKRNINLNLENIKDVNEDLSLEDSKDSKAIEIEGMRKYVLSKLNKIIDTIESGDNDDEIVLGVSRELREFAKNPVKTYQIFLDSNENNISKKKTALIKKNLNYKKHRLNTTELTLLMTTVTSSIMEYIGKDLNYESVDYGTTKVSLLVAYRAITLGLEEKKISSLVIYEGYGSTLSDFEITYEDSSRKYDLRENNMIFLHWVALDEVYSRYSMYKTEYINFGNNSLNSLATAYAAEKENEKRNVGHELLSYNGIALNYFNVFEVELKKLISQKFDVNSRNITLNDAINYLDKCNYIEFPQNRIKELHELRKLRNMVAHGHNISFEQCNTIKNVLITSGVLKLISDALRKER